MLIEVFSSTQKALVFNFSTQIIREINFESSYSNFRVLNQD